MRPHESHSAPAIPSKVNAYSLVLSSNESEQVFKMLGRKCQTLNTAVVQIYETEASAHSHWRKRHTGVICFIKDSAIRSYFLRAYCLIKHELIWEHELYESMKINKDRPFLLTFEGQHGHVGLNFVSEEECDSFYGAVNLRIEMRNRKKIEKRNRMKSQLAPSAPLIPLPKEPVNNNASTTVQLRNHPKINTFTPTTAAPTAMSATKSFFFSNKEKKRKVTKADISQPTNFLHVSHVGWNADKGFDLTGNENDEVLSQFFAKAGVSENELKDRDTRAFIYDFIQSNNVLRKVKSEQEEKPVQNITTITAINVAAPLPPPPPPVPNRFQQPINGLSLNQRTAPPPPLARKQQHEALPAYTATAPAVQSKAPVPPTRPPPINSMSAPPPPVPPPSASPALQIIPPPPPPAPVMPVPPPPPPPPAVIPLADDIQTKETRELIAPIETKIASSLPVVSDSRNDLLESIRKGVQLRKIDVAALSTSSGDSHSDLMSEIRSGIELKPTQNRELAPNRDSDEFSGTDALANALRRALQERGRVIQSSDDESESSVNDEEWDD